MSRSRQTAIRLLTSAARPVLETLENRRLLAADPLAFQNVVQTLPYALDFTKQVNGVFDAAGQSIGFTRLQVNKNGDQYQPSLINLNTAAGELDLTTRGTSTSGSNFNTDNTLVNALETQFDATTHGFTITARIKNPSVLTAAYDQGAVYFGPDQDNYVKLAAEYDATHGQTLQFVDEQNATTHTVNTYTGIGSFSAINTLDLRLTGDANGTVTASYSVNGGAFQPVAGSVTLTGAEQQAFFTSAGRAGIFVASKNDLAPVTVDFGHFEIDPGTTTVNSPSVAYTVPATGASVRIDSFVSADFHLPNGGLDPITVNGNNVYLYRTSDGARVAAIVNTSGGGDAVVLQPRVALEMNTNYTFVITAGLKDTTGASVVPYSFSFSTNNQPLTSDSTIAFQQVPQTTATGADFTCVRIGPDHMLYASSEDGRIFKYAINADGSLGAATIINSLNAANTATSPHGRLISGFTFDPASTAGNVILWVSNGYFSGQASEYYANSAPDFSGKITVMSGPNLATVQDAVVNLPRSIRDHLTEQPTFGPDGALYFCQGSNTSYGAPDIIWGMRNEHLLNAAILRLDVTKITPGQPLDAKTIDAGGTYDPFAPGAPLTIYASGIRNAFQIMFTKDGTLYAPTNGSAAGGNTPAYPNSVTGTRIDQAQNGAYTGPNVAGITNVAEAEDDWLFKVVQGGYYGHPNPTRGEYVLNGGNPTAGTDPAEVPDYPVGTQPDRNYRGYAYDFGPHRSPDGIIEYQSTSSNPKLNGALLITEYSGGNDIAVLYRDANGNITNVERGIAGLTGFQNPVNLTEDPSTGNMYVAELGGRRITLVKPIPPGAQLSTDKSVLAFNDIQTSSSGGAGPSPTQTLTITNTGTVPLTFPSDGFTVIDDTSVAGDDSAAFSVLNRLNLPTSIPVGGSAQVQLNFTAASTGLHAAFLQIKSNDPNRPVMLLPLHGLGTTGIGGANEPSLAAILRDFNIPTIVGDGPKDANAFASTFYPTPPDPSSQEVVMQRLVKAGDGPVTITPLAAFVVPNQPGARFGYYTPGDPADRTELFTINKGDSQVVNPTPQGSTAFDPGSSDFGLYVNFPTFTDNGHQRVAYSEDALNTWDTKVPRKVRFFPLENPDGSIVPNAYVFTSEDYNLQYDSNDVVGIIRNVKPAPGGAAAPVLGLQNPDAVPFTDRMLFSRIQVLNNDTVVKGDIVHDTSTLTVTNTGGSPLVINSLTFTDSPQWQIVNPPQLPVTIPAGGSLALTIKFVAQSAPPHTLNELNDNVDQEGLAVTAAGGAWNDTLTIASNDPANPTRVVQLAGYWQHHSEFEEEPSLQTVTNLMLGYQTNISSTHQPQYPNNGKTPVYYGEEVPSAYWNAADPTLPVSVRQITAFHNQEFNGSLTTATIAWFPQGAGSKNIFTHQPRESQTFLPNILGSTTAPAAGSFVPAGPFGWNVDGEKSDDKLNTTDINTFGRSGHAVRFYPVRDRSGNLIPNTWLIAMDYEDGTFDNSDYQDLTYLVTNMRPAAQPPAVSDAFAVTAAGGVSLQWAPVSYTAAATYNIYRASSPTGTYTKLNSSPLTGTSFLDNAAPGGVISYYKITAVDPTSGVESQAVNVSAAPGTVVVNAPAAPANVVATPSSTGISLTWNANTEANIAGYNVLRGTSAAGPFTQLNGALLTATTFTDNNAPQGVASFYEVVAVNTSGVSSAPTIVSATRPAAAPSAPSNLTATANSATSVTLTWSASTGTVTAYHVERMSAGGAFTEIAGNVQGTTYTDTTVQPNTSYTYRVRAEDAGTFSDYTNPPAQVTTPQPSTDPFTSLDIGGTPAGSTTVITPGSDYDVVAGGPAIYNTADGFRFVYEPQAGNFDVKVRINSITVAGAIDQAGLMARQSLDPSSPEVFVSASPSEGYRFKYRLTQAGMTNGVTATTVENYPNVWVRLQRSGNLFTGYSSSDGVNWTVVGSITLSMTDPIYIGMAAASNVATATITAQFRSFGPTAGPALPTAPVSLNAATISSSRIDLTWIAGAGATTYVVQRKGPQDVDFVDLATGLAGTSYSDTTAANHTTYSYRVLSQNAAGRSAAPSPAATATSFLLGDTNNDGVVNFTDLLKVAQNYGSATATWAQGDFTGDGKVDFADLLIIAQQYTTNTARQVR